MANQRALIVIDIQNDYFPSGHFPLWQPEACLANIETAIHWAERQNIPVVLVQHVAAGSGGNAPFFNPGTDGVAIHPRILVAAPTAPVVVKAFADCFHQTDLEQTLTALGVEELLLCGMMTHNCVTHTALSKAAERYQVVVVSDCCTTVSDLLHRIALNALAPRVPLLTLEQLLATSA